MQLLEENILRKRADCPIRKMLDLWHELAERELGWDVEVLLANRRKHAQLKDFPDELNTSYPIVKDRQVKLVLFLEILDLIEKIKVTHELGHNVLKLQGFKNLMYNREGVSHIETALNDLAHHRPLYHLQKRVGVSAEIQEYLDHLELTKFLAPPEPDLQMDDLDDETEEEAWLENPVLGAEELLCFSRIRHLLQE